MRKPGPIFVIDLLPELDQQLIALLESLSDEDWSRPTIAPQWQVKDIAAHLLDGNLRTLSMLRDQYFGESPGEVDSYQDLVAFLNQLNADWVKAMQRLSPRVIIDLLKSSGREYCDYLKTLNPAAKAVFAVAWAGEEESQNWFHIAREYTEKWTHQQQIRLAVGDEATLLAEKWYVPYLDTSARALPHSYKAVSGRTGDLVKFVFRGERDKCWFLRYADTGWELLREIEGSPDCEVRVPDQLAWKVFSKGIRQEEAVKGAEIRGRSELGLPFFVTLAVMA